MFSIRSIFAAAFVLVAAFAATPASAATRCIPGTGVPCPPVATVPQPPAAVCTPAAKEMQAAIAACNQAPPQAATPAPRKREAEAKKRKNRPTPPHRMVVREVTPPPASFEAACRQAGGTVNYTKLTGAGGRLLPVAGNCHLATRSHCDRVAALTGLACESCADPAWGPWAVVKY